VIKKPKKGDEGPHWAVEPNNNKTVHDIALEEYYVIKT
jgi:hypothetical protein